MTDTGVDGVTIQGRAARILAERDEARAALRRLHRDMGGDDRERRQRRQALDDSARLIAQWGGDDGE